VASPSPPELAARSPAHPWRRDIITKYLGTDPARVDVTVTDGVVTLHGEVEHKSMVPLATRLTRAVDGVVDVVANLSYAVDDSHLPTASELDPR